MGPSFAALNFAENFPQADFFKIILYGRLLKQAKVMERTEQLKKP